jgi:hypothetical protein
MQVLPSERSQQGNHRMHFSLVNLVTKQKLASSLWIRPPAKRLALLHNSKSVNMGEVGIRQLPQFDCPY